MSLACTARPENARYEVDGKLQDNQNAGNEIEGQICKMCLDHQVLQIGPSTVVCTSCIFMCCNLVLKFHVLHFHPSGIWWLSLSGPAFSLTPFVFMFFSRGRNVEPPSPWNRHRAWWTYNISHSFSSLGSPRKIWSLQVKRCERL